MSRRALAIVVFIVLSAVFTGGAGWIAYRSGLDQLANRGMADLSLASDRLRSELKQYRELAVLMADHPDVNAVLSGTKPPEAVRQVLLKTADKTGTLELRLLTRTGAVLVSSNRNILPAVSSRANNPAFQRAMQGALGAHHERIEGVLDRAYVFSAPIFSSDEQVIGAIEVNVNMWVVESEWLADPQAVFFTDEAGVVFLSNRTELLMRRREVASERDLASFGYTPDVLVPFVEHSKRTVGAHELWTIAGGPYLPSRGLHLTQDLPTLAMRGELLVDTRPAERVAFLQGAVAAALSLVFGGSVLLLLERRRSLSVRLEAEAAANAELERRVVERTQELSQANQALTREVAERKDAEAALKRAQDELVQAGKLSALGKMSAGLSHELNQPLMAIRSFAENAELFLDRNAPDKAAENLGRISELARRMGRIIKNLRAFARQESEPIANVDIVGVVNAVLELVETRLRDQSINLQWSPPNHPVIVKGGEVRLQQVVMNLVSNAADAMEGQAEKTIEINVEAGNPVRLTVRDHGPGIVSPDRVFDPFYTTKQVGQGEGMGLGLSISYGLVQSFGGDIRGANAGTGPGAVFTVELRPAGLKEAA